MRGAILALCAILAATGLARAIPAAGDSTRSIAVSTALELQQIFSGPVDDVEVYLRPGRYSLQPVAIADSSCGNCEDSSKLIPATAGLRVRGGRVVIAGPADRSAVIETNAGYGIFIEGCASAEIRNLTITGGRRDTSGEATDAAIVVRRSVARITGNTIVNNIGDSALVAKLVVGIMGICGREGAELIIDGNQIVRNSWDGIALYRGASAEISDNVIDGVDKARGAQIGGGRGVAIGVTWNGRAAIRRNLVKRYWKGIGLFVEARGVVEENVVEDIITWGIALWDAGKGQPSGEVSRNVIFNTGACGASVTIGGDSVATPVHARNVAPGWFRDNVLVKTAQNEKYDDPNYYCYQCALAVHAAPPEFTIAGNLFHGNRRATDDLPDYDVDSATFVAGLAPECARLAGTATAAGSDFVHRWCADAAGGGWRGEIAAVLGAQARAWNAADIDGYMEGYWKSDSLIFTSGSNTRRGWKATRDSYAARYNTPEAMGTLTFSKLEYYLLTEGSAWVLGDWSLKRAGDAPGGVFSLVLKKFPDEGWRIVHDHTSSR